MKCLHEKWLATMPLHGKWNVDDTLEIMRVPGGYIYNITDARQTTSVFVPELKPTKDSQRMWWTAEEWVATKEMISAIIFDYDYDYEELEKYVRPPEDACNDLAETIMERLGMELIDEAKHECKFSKRQDPAQF